MYNIISSGASHAIYALFTKQTALMNDGRKIGLLRGASTRMASFFYTMHRMLRLRKALLSTVHSAEFCAITTLPKNAQHCIADIKNPMFWRAIYVLLRAVFPAIRCLRFCDSNKPAMDKIFYLVHCTTGAIDRSIEMLNDYDVFGSFDVNEVPEDLRDESAQVFGEEIEEITVE